MVKIRLWGEPQEIEALIERICNSTPGIYVLSVSGNYKDRGASVYARCYLDVELTEPQEMRAENSTDSTKLIKRGCK